MVLEIIDDGTSSQIKLGLQNHFPNSVFNKKSTFLNFLSKQKFQNSI
jgi:hypothetical protein